MRELLLARQELGSEGLGGPTRRKSKRDLGAAILAAAIEDYLSLDDHAHWSAARFLYPQTREFQDHYDWVTAMADGVNPEWLRDALDRHRKEWDRQRFEAKAQEARRARAASA